jgi:hypothetical protein
MATTESLDLLVSFELFKEQLFIWINQGELQLKVALSANDGISLAQWLMEENEEAWPNVGLPLPGSTICDYYKPENKPVAEAAFGFTAGNLKAFKCQDIEYNAKSLELTIDYLQMTFIGKAVESWIIAAREVIHYIEA